MAAPCMTSVWDYSKDLTLRPDHSERPLWITQDNLILVEKFSSKYDQAIDFVIAIAEPDSRPRYIQSYRMTPDSLYSAVAVSMDADSIIARRRRFRHECGYDYDELHNRDD
jgi:DNA excision repair protein ERCC-3